MSGMASVETQREQRRGWGKQETGSRTDSRPWATGTREAVLPWFLFLAFEVQSL